VPDIKRISVTEFRANISATLEQASIEPMLVCNKRTQVNYVLITEGMFEQIASLAPQRVMAIIGGLKEDALDSVLQDIQKVQLSQNILLHDGIAPQEFSFK
jgi:PHD/YefM family antitoxin component YafN of YafNO toxin-antitoxin module